MWFKTETSCTSGSMSKRILRLFLFFALPCGWLLASCGEASEGIRPDRPQQTISAVPNAEASITAQMNAQEIAWNNGDLEGFMAAYQKSDSLVFIGKSGLKYGWQTTLENYQKGYPDAEAMGRLKFENIEMQSLGDRSAFVVGRWTLYRTADTLSGHYSLVWQYLNDRWVITADHSS